jgi:hypothetical protein
MWMKDAIDLLLGVSYQVDPDPTKKSGLNPRHVVLGSGYFG